jgi:hypothetical protein
MILYDDAYLLFLISELAKSYLAGFFASVSQRAFNSFT